MVVKVTKASDVWFASDEKSLFLGGYNLVSGSRFGGDDIDDVGE